VIILNPNVGVAPGTTTLQLGERRYYPYADYERLRGLGSLGALTPRWGLVLFAGLATFAGSLYLHRRRRR
jgi:hypothetical protein